MKIQSISIVVPTKRCVNNCPFCVSKMHDNEYVDRFQDGGSEAHDETGKHQDYIAYEKRIKFAVNNGVNTCILTGTGEVLQNTLFLKRLYVIFDSIGHPFPNIELQTTGVFLMNHKNSYNYIKLLKDLRVNTISLSVSNPFIDESNLRTIGVPKHLYFYLFALIPYLKEAGFNIRLSLNLIKSFENYTPEQIFFRVKDLGADQVTFRTLYKSGDSGVEDKWIEENSVNSVFLDDIWDFIKYKGIKLYQLPYGSTAYSVDGLSTVLDDDCMNKENIESLKYVILREDGKLYCQWDDKGSLIF